VANRSGARGAQARRWRLLGVLGVGARLRQQTVDFGNGQNLRQSAPAFGAFQHGGRIVVAFWGARGSDRWTP